MTQKHVEEALSIVENILKDTRGNAKMRAVRDQCKQVRRKLLKSLENDSKAGLTPADVLSLLAGIVGKIPGIIQAIDNLTKLNKK